MLGIIQCSTAPGSVSATPLALLALFAILASAPTADVRAQGTPLEAGDHARIAIPTESEPIVGRVESVGEGSVQLVRESDGQPFTLARDEILRVERRAGFSAEARAGIGGTIGGGLGFVIGLATTEEQRCEPGSFLCFDYPDKFMGGMGGMLLGALAGAAVAVVILPRETWQDATMPTLTVDAAPGGASVAVRIPLPGGSRR